MMKVLRQGERIFLVLVFAAVTAAPFVVPSAGGAANAPTDTTAAPGNSWLWLPVAFYTPETNLAGGAAVLRILRGAEDTTAAARPSTVSPILIFTTKDQLVAVLAADLYFRREAWRALGAVTFSRFPNKFYGIGGDAPEAQEENYTPRTLVAELQLRRRVIDALYLGGQVRVWRQEVRATEPDGLLAGGAIPGGNDGTAVGAGAIASWDTRDNVFFPTRGALHELSLLSHGPAIGSDHAFTTGIVNLRGFLPTGDRETVALQLYAQLADGSPPFHLMGLLGGQNLMRGMYEGRYRDRNLLAGQLEYRRPVWRRLGGSLFVAAGGVTPTAGDLPTARYRMTGGWGLRYLINRREGINLRLDFGYGENSSGTYIAFGEAF